MATKKAEEILKDMVSETTRKGVGIKVEPRQQNEDKTPAVSAETETK